RRVVARFREDPGSRCLVGLGDYIDRAPDDCEEGSVANALYLLQVAARFSGRVWLIQGNHETFREIPLLPHDLPEEVDLLWGPEEERYHRILHLLERGPLAAISPSGAYLAHGGFPRSPGSGALAGEFLSLDPERLLEIVWGECAAAPTHRADVRPFDEFELARFLSRSRTRVFLRGHDPGLAGRTVYGKRCLTLHTSRLYERFGGVLLARLPLDRPVENADDIVVERLPPDPPPGDPTR
ncbi:MAG TPA: metallophosphoesterase, partial [Thermoplasmata archaeon]|nr:metallophosphoesterase [Thermoplasmata archaeon]